MNSDNAGGGFGSFLSTFIMGAAAGAAVALLTAPRTGRDMRTRLKGAARGMGERMQQIPDAVQNDGAKAVKAGQAALDQVKQVATPTYNMAADTSHNAPQRFNK